LIVQGFLKNIILVSYNVCTIECIVEKEIYLKDIFMQKLLILGFFTCTYGIAIAPQADAPEPEKKSTTHEALENFKRESEWAKVQLPKNVLDALLNIVDDKNYDIVCGYAKEIRSTKKVASLRLAVLIHLNDIFIAHDRSLLNLIFSFDTLYIAYVLNRWRTGGFINAGSWKYLSYVAAYVTVKDLLTQGYNYYQFDEHVSRFETILNLLSE
jgi:hypothetical protein